LPKIGKTLLQNLKFYRIGVKLQVVMTFHLFCCFLKLRVSPLSFAVHASFFISSFQPFPTYGVLLPHRGCSNSCKETVLNRFRDSGYLFIKIVLSWERQDWLWLRKGDILCIKIYIIPYFKNSCYTSYLWGWELGLNCIWV